LTASPLVRYDNIYLYVAYLIVLTNDENLEVTWEPYETDEVQGTITSSNK
jgi:hypothetical protein